MISADKQIVGDPLYTHLTDELLQQFARGTLPESNPGVAKDHWLICRGCRSKLMDYWVFTRNLAEAAATPKTLDGANGTA